MFWVWGSGGLNLLVSSRKRQCNGALTDHCIIKYNRHVSVLAWTRRVMEFVRTAITIVGSGLLTLVVLAWFTRSIFNAIDEWMPE